MRRRGRVYGVGCCGLGEGVAVMRQWPGESELGDWPCATSIAFSKYCEFASRHHDFPAKLPRYPSFSFVLLYTERWLLKLQMAVPVAVTLPSRCASSLSSENID